MAAGAKRDKTEATRQKEAELAGLFEEYYDKIAHYAFLRIGNKPEAEDIAEQVFLKALDSMKSYEERGIPMQAWLFRIAHNLVVDYLRKMTMRRTVPVDTIEVEGEDDPAAIAERNIQFERVSRAMEQLTLEQRDVLGLRFFGGLTSREAGTILNKSDGAVREMQRAAIQKLRKLLVEESRP